MSQRNRNLRGEVNTNANAALGAFERCHESPEKKENGIREDFLEEVASGFSR